jgi:serine/threonine protein kinase/tetratricopeptide (TPR) repeat protein
MIGQMLLHYRILEKLGQGGMGVVYKAQDTHLDRFVAIKVLPTEKVTDPERRRRFMHEAKAASALNHPNIVVIHDINEVNGVYFIAMEYVAGRTLHDLILDKRLGMTRSLDYTIQIADALSKAHSAGVIHRDLKPSNVMVTEDGLVKVLDFGLAKLMGWQSGPGATEEDITRSFEQVTKEGIILGTLGYMSPEQARGQDVDYRTDIFSLGVVLYNMIAGELPFSGPHAAAVLEKLLHSPTPSLKSSNPNVPDALEQTIACATAKNPEDRFQTMQELASALRSLGGPADRAATTASAMVLQPKKRLKIGWRSAILAVAILLCSLLLMLPFRGRLPPWLGGTALPARIRLAVLPFNNIGSDAENQLICDGLMEILTTKFNQIEQFRSALNVVPASEVRAEKVTSASHARRAFGANLVLTGSSQKDHDRVVLTINLVDADSLRQIDGKIYEASTNELMDLENTAFSKAVAMLELKLNPTERQMLDAGKTTVSSAYNFYLQAIGYLARYDKSENLDKAIQLFQQAIQQDSSYALAYAGLGEAYWQKFRSTKESKWADAALFSCESAYRLDNRLARVHTTLGMVYTGTGRPEKGAAELNRAIVMEPRSSEAYRELGRAYEAMGKTDEAESTYRKAIQLQPDSWPCYWNLGAFYYRRARYEEAESQFLEVIRLAPDHFSAYSSLGGIYLYQGKFDKAEDIFRKSLAIRPYVQAYSNLAASCILQGRSADAVPLLERATRMEDATHEVWGNLGDAYAETPGLSARAPAAYKRALALATDYLAANPQDGTARAQMAFYLIRLGEKKRAIEQVEQALKQAPEDANVPFWAAVVYEATGDRERALNALAEAVAGGYSLAVVRAVSDLRELRKDPRYRDLVEANKRGKALNAR